MRGEVGFVDDEEVALGNARTAFARNFFTSGHVDHIDRQVAQFRAEGRRQIVAAALDEHHIGVWKFDQHAVNRFEVDGGVFANGCVGATPGLDTHDALRRQRTADGEQTLVFLGVDVVGDGHKVIVVTHGFAQHF